MDKQYQILEKLLNNRFRALHHLLFIGVIFFFWFLFSINDLNSLKKFAQLIFYAGTYIFIAYFNIYFLFKRYLLPGHIIHYLFFSLATFICSYIGQKLIYMQNWEDLRKNMVWSVPLITDMLINMITYWMFIGIGLSMKMIKMWLNSEKRIFSLERENLKATLNSLKSQVSPHFLFNTFNNLYVLTKTQPLLAAEMILGFSDLMRYQLNECEKEKIDIEGEISYIRNFLALEKLRKDKLDIRIIYNETEVEGTLVEPLLFGTLIENAIKHGSQQMEEAFIYVKMEKKNGFFYFEVINSKPSIPQMGKESFSQKGIYNLKKRLELAYPDSHHLELLSEEIKFTAKLQLKLR